MYLSAGAILRAIHILKESVHPFIGITFISCKRHGLIVGGTEEISLDALTRSHMDEHHRIDRRSSHYFQPFRGSSRWWVADKYPSSGLQTVNTQTFISAFLHPRKRPEWGFQSEYLKTISEILEQQGYTSKIPADALAAWLFKDENLQDIDNYHDLVEHFFEVYSINKEERRRIFSARSMVNDLVKGEEFVSEPFEMNSILRELPRPPDATAEGGRTIASLNLVNAGPTAEMTLDFGQRLSVVTGDNGLGKSFLLDFTWWAATGHWPDKEALPFQKNSTVPAQVEYTLSTLSGRLSKFSAKYDSKNLSWTRPRDAMIVEALAVFSRADGSFAVADPTRTKFNRTGSASGSLSAAEVWNGRPGVIEGLIRDWVRWQSSADRKTFDQFASVLSRLSPEDLGKLTPGPTVRLPGDPREIPTVCHRYGVVPVTHTSSGVQRVLLLAYLIIWTWQEHELAAQGLGQSPLRRIMVVVDELEAHLHPKWQRSVLPALMGVSDLLSGDLALQMIAATHSPMILASIEAIFDASTDVLYHLYGDGSDVKLEQTPFVKYGDASGWLTSPLFGLRHARSREADLAIEDAKALQVLSDPKTEDVQSVTDRLKMHLAGDDKFWPRWLYFAELHGAKV